MAVAIGDTLLQITFSENWIHYAPEPGVLRLLGRIKS